MACGLTDAVNAGAPFRHVDIEAEHFRLAQRFIKLACPDELTNFPSNGFFLREKRVFHDLLSERARPAGPAFFLEVLSNGLLELVVINTLVVEETGIFGRDYGHQQV